MTVRVAEDGTIMMEGRCPLEDAEVLARLLTRSPSATADWRDCEDAHTGVTQILLAARPATRGAIACIVPGELDRTCSHGPEVVIHELDPCHRAVDRPRIETL